MKKTFLKGLTIVAMALTLTACGDKVTTQDYEKWATENGYVKADAGTTAETKNELEVAFGSEVSKLDAAQYLQNLIGSVSADGTETFGEKKDLLLFYGVNECTTCDAVKAVLNQWVEETGYKVYYYNSDDDSSASPSLAGYAATTKAAIVRKLGAASGLPTDLTSGTLYAFVDGARAASISGTADVTVAKVTELANKHFSVPATPISVKVKKELTTLAELRQSIANNEQFIMYNTRFNCPWCRKLADTKRDNIINRIMREYEGNFYTITSEKVLNEYNNIYVTVDGENVALADGTESGAMTVWQYWYNLDNGATPDVVNTGATIPAYWPNTATAVQKAEVLLYLVATGEVSHNASATGITDAQQLQFIKDVAAYAAKDEIKFEAIDRNIPAFTAVGWGTTAARANTAAISIIIARRTTIVSYDFTKTTIAEIFGITPNNVHRVLFPQYFTGAGAGGSTSIDSPSPVSDVELAHYSLLNWMNTWKYTTTE